MDSTAVADRSQCGAPNDAWDLLCLSLDDTSTEDANRAHPYMGCDNEAEVATV